MANIVFSRTLWIGIVMLGLGFEVWFVNDLSLPIEFVWIVGPLLWYGGFAVVTTFFISRIFSHVDAPGNPQVQTVKSHSSSHASKAATIVCCVAAILLIQGNAFAADSSTTFKAKCAMCHGATGDGKTAMGARLNIPDLGSKAVQSQTDAELNAAITNGKAKMPAFAGKLSKPETAAMVTYIRNLQGK